MSSVFNELNQKLALLSVTGLAAILGLNSFRGFIHHKKIRESGFYKDSLEMVNHYPPAVEHLGKPIKGHRITYADPENKLTDTDICVKVPLHGPEGDGILYTWATRKSMKDKWIIDRLDIKILNGGKWTFYVKEAQPEELNENGTEETNNTDDENKI